MSRRKKITIEAKATSFYQLILSELSKNPELADYDMSFIEVTVKKIEFLHCPVFGCALVARIDGE